MPLRGRLFQPARSLLALTLIASALLQADSPARAAMTYEVQVGRFFKQTDHTAESMRFYPSSVDLYPGDVLRFTTESFHDVALLPAGADPAEWVPTYAGGFGRPFSLFQSDSDDGPDAVKANLAVLSPSRRCGWPTLEQCGFDGSGDPALGVLNSGLPLFARPDGFETTKLDFSVEITADPGTTIWAVDLLHPAMRMQINVVDIDAAATSPEAAEEQGNELFAADKRAAANLHERFSKKRVKKKVKGVTTWTAWAGVESPTVSLRRMYPSKLNVTAGDKVKWVFSKNRFEAHTVTFPRARGTQMANAFPEISCDPDTDSGPGPDTEGSSVAPFCPDSPQVEVDVDPALPYGSGDRKVTKASDFEHSGVRGASFATSKAAHVVTFSKPAKQLGYMCVIHQIAHAPMPGSVVVKAGRR